MENREKLEIPTIEFTAVTLLTTYNSTCTCNGFICTDLKKTEGLYVKQQGDCSENF